MAVHEKRIVDFQVMCWCESKRDQIATTVVVEFERDTGDGLVPRLLTVAGIPFKLERMDD